MRVPERLLKLIKGSSDFLIVTHIKPEGDAIGSSLALALGLRTMGKRVYLVDRDPVPSFLKFLPASGLFRTQPPRRICDVLLLLDCSTLERTGFRNGLKANKIVIVDHHILKADVVPMTQNALRYIHPEAASTGVLVYNILKRLGVPIDKRIATNLYTSILVDTGGFRYSNTEPICLKIASSLVEAGARPWEITKEIYEKVDLKSVRLLSLSLDTLKVKECVASMSVTKDMLRSTGTTSEDTEDFVNYPRSIDGVEVAIFFREEDSGFCKVSLRSKSNVNVEKIAGFFGGGGHAAAAGCRVRGSLKAVERIVLQKVIKVVKKG